MNKVWLNQYPKGMPAEIDLSAYSSVEDVFRKSCTKFLSKPAFSNLGGTLSFNELDGLATNMAAYFQKVLGLKKGDRIAIQMPNLLQYPVVVFGALRAGLVVVNTNPLYTERELEHQMRDSGAKAIVVLANMACTLEKVLKRTALEHVIVTEIGDLLPFPKNYVVNFVVKNIKKMVPPFSLPQAIPFKQALAEGARKSYDPVPLNGDDLAFLQYTGGTTGISKGAMLSHGNVVANMQQISAWISQDLVEGEEIVITALPLYHIFSLTVNCLALMKIGGHNILITNPRDMKAFIKDLSQYPFTVLTGVNTLFNALLHQEDFKKLNFKSLKITVGGAMAVQRAVAEKWKQVTGCALVEGYGLTESSPVLCANRLDGFERVGTIGLPVPSTEVAIFDDAMKPVEKGQAGELCARGPQIMKGYWQRPDESAKTIRDGWLCTGDIAVMDEDGYFRIVDRKKDMILVSGFNVYPNEVEDVVASHPGVLEVAAVGVPDERSGEIVKIVVVKKDESLTAQDLKSFCKDRLTGYKVPRIVEFRTELPKTNVGKILRRELREKPTVVKES